MRANNNHATAQVRKETPSLVDVKGLGRPKEFTGREEDLQQWSKKTEAFFAGVIKESEMMLEWAAEQPTEITTTAIDLELLPTDSNEDRGIQNLEFVLQQMRTALMALTSSETNDIVSNSRKTPGRCSLLELQAGIESWESYVSRYENKMEDKLDDEIKLAGLESLVPEELEKHLILNSNRLRTFEDAQRSHRMEKRQSHTTTNAERAIIGRTLTGKARMNAYKDSVAETERVKERKRAPVERGARDVATEPGSRADEQVAVMRTHLAVTSGKTNAKRTE